jgi:hypothetical protein
MSKPAPSACCVAEQPVCENSKTRQKAKGAIFFHMIISFGVGENMSEEYGGRLNGILTGEG